MNTYIYELDGNLYINLTNKCSNACEFCVRSGKDSYFGHKLWLDKEPSAKEVIAQIGDLSKYNEVVFCGFGEPLYRLSELKEIAAFVKSKGGLVRINTNGQGNLINGRDITGELKGVVDKINVSLNAGSAAEYQKICSSVYGEDAFFALLKFAVLCRDKGIDTVLSVVDTIGQEEIERCKLIAESHGLTLRVREYIEES